MKLNAMSVLALCVGIIVMGSPCFGQANACSPIGTWIGGSDPATPYHMTITPIGGDRYAIRAQQPLDYPGLGILGVTDWTGELFKVSGKKYETNMVAFYWLSPEVQADLGVDGPLDMDAVHSTIEFNENCDKIKNTITTFIGYIPWTEEKVPFVTLPDYNYLEDWGVSSLDETYQRVPTVCTICPAAPPKHPASAKYNVRFPLKKR